MDIAFDSQSIGMPGYLAMMKRVQGHPGIGVFRPAFNSLDIMPVGTADNFLREKIKRLLPDDEDKQDAAVEIVLGFAVMMVEADREESFTLEELMVEADREESFTLEELMEREQTDGDQGISW